MMMNNKDSDDWNFWHNAECGIERIRNKTNNALTIHDMLEVSSPHLVQPYVHMKSMMSWDGHLTCCRMATIRFEFQRRMRWCHSWNALNNRNHDNIANDVFDSSLYAYIATITSYRVFSRYDASLTATFAYSYYTLYRWVCEAAMPAIDIIADEIIATCVLFIAICRNASIWSHFASVFVRHFDCILYICLSKRA